MVCAALSSVSPLGPRATLRAPLRACAGPRPARPQVRCTFGDARTAQRWPRVLATPQRSSAFVERAPRWRVRCLTHATPGFPRLSSLGRLYVCRRARRRPHARALRARRAHGWIGGGLCRPGRAPACSCAARLCARASCATAPARCYRPAAASPPSRPPRARERRCRGACARERPSFAPRCLLTLCASTDTGLRCRSRGCDRHGLGGVLFGHQAAAT